MKKSPQITPNHPRRYANHPQITPKSPPPNIICGMDVYAQNVNISACTHCAHPMTHVASPLPLRMFHQHVSHTPMLIANRKTCFQFFVQHCPFQYETKCLETVLPLLCLHTLYTAHMSDSLSSIDVVLMCFCSIYVFVVFVVTPVSVPRPTVL